MLKSKKCLFGLGVLAALIIFIVVVFNGLVKKEEDVNSGVSGMQSAYQRRADLIPQLTKIVQSSGQYEADLLKQIAETRSKAASVNSNITEQNIGQVNAINDTLVQQTNRLIAVVEKYPNLQSTNAFLRLQDQIVGTERRIKVARTDFNNYVATYNTAVRRFPGSLVASLTGFKIKAAFEAVAGASQAPQITFKN
jgi:LemA protein